MVLAPGLRNTGAGSTTDNVSVCTGTSGLGLTAVSAVRPTASGCAKSLRPLRGAAA